MEPYKEHIKKHHMFFHMIETGVSRCLSSSFLRYIQSTWSAFAAVRRDGLVVTWGEAAAGGDSNEVREQLRDVQQIQVGTTKTHDIFFCRLGYL